MFQAENRKKVTYSVVPHSRSGRAHACGGSFRVSFSASLTCNRVNASASVIGPSRHTFFFINPHQRVLQFGPASGSLVQRDSGQHHDCCTDLPCRGLTAQLLHDELPPVNDKEMGTLWRRVPPGAPDKLTKAGAES